MTTGQELFELVRAYAGVGEHRTGTPADRATRDWFAGELTARGAAVEERPYRFDRFDAELGVTVDGQPVPALPLYYHGTGNVELEAPSITRLPMLLGLFPSDLDAAIGSATRHDPPAAVLGVEGPEGRLVALNVAPVPVDGPPIVLVGARDAERVAARGSVALDSRIVPGRSANIVARLGPDDTGSAERPVVLTTPLTGWFACAGERGTGVAITLALATELARRQAVVVAATTGHELEYLGAEHLLSSELPDAKLVVQVGASVAACDGPPDDLHLSELRAAFLDTAGTPLDVDAIRRALAPARLGLTTDAETWPHEGQGWRGRGCPVLSFTGGSERFHTPDDLPEQATTPEALATALEAITDAIDHLIP